MHIRLHSDSGTSPELLPLPPLPAGNPECAKDGSTRADTSAISEHHSLYHWEVVHPSRSNMQ